MDHDTIDDDVLVIRFIFSLRSVSDSGGSVSGFGQRRISVLWRYAGIIMVISAETPPLSRPVNCCAPAIVCDRHHQRSCDILSDISLHNVGCISGTEKSLESESSEHRFARFPAALLADNNDSDGILLDCHHPAIRR